MAAPISEAPFVWPRGKRAGVSITFDDARMSQSDIGLPLFDRLGLKATFYVLGRNVSQRLEGWQALVKAGHEIGNHTSSHPCSINHSFSSKNALENYNLEQMGSDIDAASVEIEQLLGVRPVSFAYPCGQKFVGRGVGVRSYVPLIAERFLTGRGYHDEGTNDPRYCDFAQLNGTGFDGLNWEQMRSRLNAAAADGRWLIFAGHEIGQASGQTTDVGALTSLAEYVNDSANGIYLDTVGNIARFIAASSSRQSP